MISIDLIAAAGRGWRSMRAGSRLAAVMVATLVGLTAGCKDSNVPYLIDPTSVAATPTGVQNAITGLFSASRNDVGGYITFLSTFARDAAVFVGTEPRYITEGTGVMPIPNTDQFFSSSVWDDEFRTAKFANQIITTLPTIAPPYSPDSIAAIVGIVQTMKALNFMMLAETRDSLGVSPYSIDVTNGTPAPVYCNQDMWAYIVALLDSANVALDSAGSRPLPVQLPPGFGSVSTQAGPSTVAGSFAAFNRALAGKAGLEYAYAIARQNGAGATPTTSGSPNPAALLRADSAIKASALFAPASITPVPASGFVAGDPFTVSHAWSPSSGDQVNPINGQIGEMSVLWDLVADVDTAHDLRWATKFGVNPNTTIALASFNGIASPFSFSYYSSTSTPIPIVRNEELTLVDAQIQLALGNFGSAITLINDVHEEAGGYATPLSIAPTYTAVRDSLMKEQRISTVLEASEDRLISIRLYGLATVADTTWNATAGPDSAAAVSAKKSVGNFTDLHTTVLPPPATEPDGRGGNYTLTCPAVTP